MSKITNSVWIWQQMITPHVVALAAALAGRGFEVNFVANEKLSKDRIKQGWEILELGKVKLLLAPNKETVIRYVSNAPENSIHLCQGLRGNGLVSCAQRVIRKRGLRHWVMMETVDDLGWNGLIKKFLYRILFLYWQKNLSGVLAIGQNMVDWIVARGMDKNCISLCILFKEPRLRIH